MIKVLFICWGNICRSPAGQFILQNMVAEMGVSDEFIIDSAATSTEEIGNGIYPPMMAELKRRGIGSNPRLTQEENRRINADMQAEAARQITKQDYRTYDYILIAEPMLFRRVEMQTGPDVDGKVHCLLEWAVDGELVKNLEISDPWYTRNFAKACDDIEIGCRAFLEFLGY